MHDFFKGFPSHSNNFFFMMTWWAKGRSFCVYLFIGIGPAGNRCGSQGGSCDWSVFSQLISDWLLSWNTNSCCSQIVASLVFNCYRQNSEHFCDLYNLWFILKLKLCCMFIHFNNFRNTRFPPLPWISPCSSAERCWTRSASLFRSRSVR